MNCSLALRTSGCVGEVIAAGNESLHSLVQKVQDAGVGAIAISPCFLFPSGSRRANRGVAGGLGVPLSVSSRILPEYREYERTSTVVINAYLQPLMGRYLRPLTEGKPSKTQLKFSLVLRVMQSSGGSISAEVAASEPVRTILSGPSGGVVGALRSAATAGIKNVITFDMVVPRPTLRFAMRGQYERRARRWLLDTGGVSVGYTHGWRWWRSIAS